MKKQFKFEVAEFDWNYVDEKGLPSADDGMWCILIWKDSLGDYEYSFGGYREESNTFYVNFGYGGCVLDADDVVAWAPLFTDETEKFLKIIEA